MIDPHGWDPKYSTTALTAELAGCAIQCIALDDSVGENADKPQQASDSTTITGIKMQRSRLASTDTRETNPKWYATRGADAIDATRLAIVANRSQLQTLKSICCWPIFSRPANKQSAPIVTNDNWNPISKIDSGLSNKNGTAEVPRADKPSGSRLKM